MDCNVSYPSTVVNPTGSTGCSPDPLVDEIFAMMPQVMEKVAIMNVTGISQVRQLEQWTRRLLKQAYFATWTAMSIEFSSLAYDRTDGESKEGPLSSSIKVPVQMVKASVYVRRIWLWLALNGLVTMSGLFLLIWQSACERKPVVDPVLSAVMLDPRKLLDKDSTWLCDASRLTSVDGELGLLRWRRADSKDGEGHFLLDKA